MLTSIILCLSVTPALATNNNNFRGYIWNQLTGEVIPYDQSNYQPVVEIPSDTIDTEPIQDKVRDGSDIKPQIVGITKTFILIMLK